MNFSIYCLYAFLALLRTTSALSPRQNDALQKYEYKVHTFDNGHRWEVHRGLSMIDDFSIDSSLSQLTVFSAWNSWDKTPRLRMRDIFRLVLAGAEIPLDKIDSIRAMNVRNKETMEAVAKTRRAIGVQREGFTVERGAVGWNEITKSPFYLSLYKLFTERPELRNREVTAIKVQEEWSARPDTMYLLIGDKTG
ncbi:hypothetical protein LZ30DRAFT_773986 [Colletotrichum cereale]|nr:hypothetical protein LZ30DRAFT_773986 [Colletotrichum cereale]